MLRAETCWNSWRKALVEAVYPPQCALCGLPELPPICGVCAGSFEPFHTELVRTTGGALDAWVCVWRYTGRAAQAVQRLKYARATSVAHPMAGTLAEVGDRLGLIDVDAIVPVPIHWARRCERGFNQAELLCEGFAPKLVQPTWLTRPRATRPQAGLDRAERAENLHGAFQADPQVRGRRILLVDDVRTSGGTLEACAQALRAEGAQEVLALTFAGG